MHWKTALIEVFDGLRHWLEPFVPGALGAAIGQMWEKGLGWRDRIAQWAAALIFAAYLVPAFGHVFGWGIHLMNAAGLVVGTLVLKAYVPIRDAAISGAALGVKEGLSNLGSWFPRRGSTPVPPNTEGEG